MFTKLSQVVYLTEEIYFLIVSDLNCFEPGVLNGSLDIVVDQNQEELGLLSIWQPYAV